MVFVIKFWEDKQTAIQVLLFLAIENLLVLTFVLAEDRHARRGPKIILRLKTIIDAGSENIVEIARNNQDALN